MIKTTGRILYRFLITWHGEKLGLVFYLRVTVQEKYPSDPLKQKMAHWLQTTQIKTFKKPLMGVLLNHMLFLSMLNLDMSLKIDTIYRGNKQKNYLL